MLWGWIENLDFIATLDVDRIVPGHGPLSSKKDVADLKTYLIVFDRLARELATHGDDAQAIAVELLKRLPAKAQGE